MGKRRPKLLFFVTVDWFFCSHFLGRAIAARDAGYDVLVMTNVDCHGEAIRSAGFQLIHLPVDRRSLNPLPALFTLFSVVKVYWIEKPDLLHHVALKPILLGSLAAYLTNRHRVVNAVVGMGYAFTSASLTARVVRQVLRFAFRFLLNPSGSKVIFENSEDLNTFVSEGFVNRQDAVLIKGAGVVPDEYCKGADESQIPIVILVARLLWNKGVGEFVAAAKLLRDQGILARFWIVGGQDIGNRSSIERETLLKWHEEGVVELFGYRDDVKGLLSKCHIACLPSYREGLPRSLLEAMASSLPCVTTDVPGCREVVTDGDNGILVPPRNYLALADALKKLIESPLTRQQMGQRGRQRLEQEFSEQIVVSKTLELYRIMLG